MQVTNCFVEKIVFIWKLKNHGNRNEKNSPCFSRPIRGQYSILLIHER